MKQFIKDNWFKLSLLVIIIIFIGGWFYWFQLRPIDIRKNCWAKAYRDTMNIKGDRTDANYFYERCFRENGLKDSY